MSGLVIFFLMAVREGVGCDYYDIYVAGFEAHLRGEPTRFEPGYQCLQSIASFFSNDYHAIFILSSAINVSLTYIAIWRLSCNPALSIFIYLTGGFFFYSEDMIRQCLASAILLNAVFYMQKDMPIKYALLVILATSFHTVSIIFLPIYLLRKVKIPLPVIMVLGFLAIFFSGEIVNLVINEGSKLIPQLSQYKSNTFYLKPDFDTADFILILFSLSACAYVSRGFSSLDALTRVYTNLFLCALCICLLSSSIFIIYRVVRLFIPFLILYIPAIVDKAGTKMTRLILLFLVICLFTSSSVYLYGISNFGEVTPYKTFIFD